MHIHMHTHTHTHMYTHAHTYTVRTLQTQGREVTPLMAVVPEV